MRETEKLGLDEKAYGCLSFIEQNKLYARKLPDRSGCDLHTLQMLESLGLIEQVHDICLPLEMARIYFRLTDLGSMALHQHQVSGTPAPKRR